LPATLFRPADANVFFRSLSPSFYSLFFRLIVGGSSSSLPSCVPGISPPLFSEDSLFGLFLETGNLAPLFRGNSSSPKSPPFKQPLFFPFPENQSCFPRSIRRDKALGLSGREITAYNPHRQKKLCPIQRPPTLQRSPSDDSQILFQNREEYSPPFTHPLLTSSIRLRSCPPPPQVPFEKENKYHCSSRTDHALLDE